MKHRNFQTQRDPFSKNAQGVSRNYHEVLLLMNFLQTKPQVRNMNNNYYDLYYTVIKNKDDKKIVDDKFEKKEDEYNNLNDVIMPNRFVGIKE